MTIDKLKALDLEKVDYESLKQSAIDIIDGYTDNEDQENYLEEFKHNIEAVYKLIETNSPEALPENQEKKNESNQDKNKVKNVTKKKKLTKTEMEAFEEEIEQCRTAIKDYNAKKREGKPKKPKPKRHEKIQKNLLAIANLVPDNLKDNLDILEKAEEILSKTGIEIMKLYRMDELEIKEVQQEIKEKYEEKEEKIKKDNDE